MADVVETITEVVPHMGVTMIYFTGTKVGATDSITFGDFRTVLCVAAQTGGVDDPVTAITTNTVTFSVGTGTINGMALVIR